jgi:4-hydroxythreonine-4-phosphate dehydrogenase
MGLANVRSPHDVLCHELAEAVSSANIVILDAETDDDLTAIARAAIELPGILLVGSGGLAAAVGRIEGAGPRHSVATGRDGARPITVIIGTAEPHIAEQIARLRQTGAVVHRLTAGVGAPAIDFEHEVRAIVIEWGSDPRVHAPRVIAALSELAPELADCDLILIGGDTARTVLDLIAEPALHPLAEVTTGAVVSRTKAGRIVATRPGSFGERDSLVDLVAAVRALRERTASEPDRKRKVGA